MKQVYVWHYVILIVLVLTGCVPLKEFGNQQKVQQQLKKSSLTTTHFSGFVLYDPSENKYLIEQHADHHFIPASNTKLLTFLAGLHTLGDSLPGLKYHYSGDTLYIQGTGDPTFLHPDFPDQPVLQWLQSIPDSLLIVVTNGEVRDRYGSGWAWDDYQYQFQAERSAFPVHGNFVSISVSDTGVLVTPRIFQPLVEVNETGGGLRDELYNYFVVSGNVGTTHLPFKTSGRLVSRILADTLKRRVAYKDTMIDMTHLVKSIPPEEVYRSLLLQSNNFLAEQTLLMATHEAGFGWNEQAFITWFIRKHLSSLSNPPVWRDGAGLSRYNLITPRAMAQTVHLIAEKIGMEEAKSFLPAGGQSGTLKEWYKAPKPYVFAKTGTLSNVHCLSGYIETQSGKTLVFSFMNNNFTSGSAAVKNEMEKVLRLIRERY